MKFTKIGPNHVESDSGFQFWMPKPFELHYIEGEREITLPGEILTGDKDLLVSVSTIKGWKPPFDRDAVDNEKKKQIISNVASALEFMGVRYDFD